MAILFVYDCFRFDGGMIPRGRKSNWPARIQLKLLSLSYYPFHICWSLEQASNFVGVCLGKRVAVVSFVRRVRVSTNDLGRIHLLLTALLVCSTCLFMVKVLICRLIIVLVLANIFLLQTALKSIQFSSVVPDCLSSFPSEDGIESAVLLFGLLLIWLRSWWSGLVANLLFLITH